MEGYHCCRVRVEEGGPHCQEEKDFGEEISFSLVDVGVGVGVVACLWR